MFPTPESYGPLCPQSLYAASKLASEALLSAYAHSYGLRVHLFRFANIIGPGMGHGILPDFLDKLRKDPSRLEVLGDGRQAKSYLRTEDCVGGMLLARDRAHDPVNIFNLGAADQITVREIAEKVVAATGGRARIVYTGGTGGGPATSRCNCSRSRRCANWDGAHSFRAPGRSTGRSLSCCPERPARRKRPPDRPEGGTPPRATRSTVRGRRHAPRRPSSGGPRHSGRARGHGHGAPR